MKWFYNLKIAAKLLISFILVSLLASVVGIMGIINMGKVNSMLNNMYDNNLVPIIDIANANMQAIYHNRAVYDYIIEPEKSGMDTIKQRMDKNEEKMKQLLDKYRKTVLTEREKQLLAKFDDSWVTYMNSVAKALSLSYEGKNNEAMALVNGEVTKTFQVSDDLLTELVNVNQGLGKEAYAESDTVFFQSRNFMITLVIVCLMIGIGLAFFISAIISNPIKKIVTEAQKIAKGDLDIHLEVETADEVGELSQAFTDMANNINEVMTNINSAAEQVASGSKQVSDSSIALSQGATEQASSIEQLTASIEEIASQTKLNANNANQANE
ncbi:MAG TPA: methyl-accepting chemotaxis protein, partial [Bacillota bacterium]|nr:methyl-accepting chemotaxis protein [Bacillota bacterium]